MSTPSDEFVQGRWAETDYYGGYTKAIDIYGAGCTFDWSQHTVNPARRFRPDRDRDCLQRSLSVLASRGSEPDAASATCRLGKPSLTGIAASNVPQLRCDHETAGPSLDSFALVSPIDGEIE